MGYSCNSISECDFGGAGGTGSTGSSTSGHGGPGGTTSNDNPTSSTDATSATATSTSTGQTGKGQLHVCFAVTECSGGASLSRDDEGRRDALHAHLLGQHRVPGGLSLSGSRRWHEGLPDERHRSKLHRRDTVRLRLPRRTQDVHGERTTGADCPNGWGCMLVGGQNVCVKAEAPCSAVDSSACIAPAACDESPTLVVGGCTLACNSAADCPQRAAGLAPWTCNGLCRRPSDVFGPLAGG